MYELSKPIADYVARSIASIDACKSIKEARKATLKAIIELDKMDIPTIEFCVADATIKTAFYKLEDRLS